MKISELIQELTAIQEAEGDLDVVATIGTSDDLTDVEGASAQGSILWYGNPVTKLRCVLY